MKTILIIAALLGSCSSKAEERMQEDDPCEFGNGAITTSSSWIEWDSEVQELEISKERYANLTCVAKKLPGVRPDIAKAISDGKITYREWRDISDAQSREWELRDVRQRERTKAQLKAALEPWDGKALVLPNGRKHDR